MANRFNNVKNSTQRNRKWFAVLRVAAFAAALSFSEMSSWAQFPGGATGEYGRGPGGYGGGYGGPPTNVSPGDSDLLLMGNSNDPAVKAQMDAWRTVATATSEFRSAQGEAKAAAQKKLVAALTQYFDADMKLREANLQKVEAQVKTLRSQFDKRASKKQEILDLQLKLFANETEGLGFFNIAQPNGMPLMPAPALAPQFTDPGTDWVTSWGAPAVGPAPAPTSGGNAGGMMAPTRAASPQPRPKDAPTPGAATLRGGPENPPAPAPRPSEEGGNQE